ncbi:MAG: CBS domain-containing protein [Hyphomicrobiaceae bacterium]
MHKAVTWVDANATVREIAQKMQAEDIGAIPVGENDRLIGMITDRDIAIRSFDGTADPGSLKARDVMSKGIVYCQEDQEVNEAARLMEEKQVRRMPVLDGNKRMSGMLSLGDLAQAVPRKTAGEILSAVSSHHAS